MSLLIAIYQYIVPECWETHREFKTSLCAEELRFGGYLIKKNRGGFG